MNETYVDQKTILHNSKEEVKYLSDAFVYLTNLLGHVTFCICRYLLDVIGFFAWFYVYE